MLDARHPGPEIIDDPALPDSDYAAAMDDLAKVNFWLRGHAPTLSFLTRRAAGMQRFSLLDVGAGQGDLLRAIGRWARRRGIAAELHGIDLAGGGTLASRRAGTDAEYHVGDIFDHCPEHRYDFVVSSLFTHHLPDAQIVRFLRWMQQNCRRAWHVNDLHRHPLALWSYRALAGAMRWHPIVRHDGAISVQRAFSREDWMRLCREANVKAEIRWHPLFRWGVSGSACAG